MTPEANARAIKAAKLVSVLREAGMTAAEAQASSEQDWLLAAQAANAAGKNGDRIPSETTRAMVVERLKAFEAPAPKIYVGRCEVCEKEIYSDEPHTSSFDAWHYHTACWNQMHAKDAGWQR